MDMEVVVSQRKWLSAGTIPSADVHRNSIEEAPVRLWQSPAVARVAELTSSATVTEKEGGVSIEEVPVRPLQSVLFEERLEDCCKYVEGGHSNGDSVQVTLVPVNDDASSQVVTSTYSNDSKNDFQGQVKKFPQDCLDSELIKKLGQLLKVVII